MDTCTAAKEAIASLTKFFFVEGFLEMGNFEALKLRGLLWPSNSQFVNTHYSDYTRIHPSRVDPAAKMNHEKRFHSLIKVGANYEKTSLLLYLIK
jgi:hypothetical protein